MTAPTHGMNPAEVQQLGSALQAAAQELRAKQRLIDQVVHSAHWTGPDADLFVRRWWPEKRSRLQALATDLEGFGQSALNNASEQLQVSSVAGGGAMSGGGNPPAFNSTDRDRNAIWKRIPDGSHATTSDYVSEITHLKPGEIAVRKVDDGPPPRYVVMLRGLDMGSSGSNDITSTLKDFSGHESDYQREIRRVLGGLPPDAEIAMIGHSQGGIAAVEVAQADDRIRDVLTLGSPIENRAIRPGLNVLSIVNAYDPVPATDGAHAGDDRQVTFYTSTPDRYVSHIGENHAIQGNYLDEVEALEGSDRGQRVEAGAEHGARWIADFEAKYGGSGESESAHLAGDQPNVYLSNEPTF